MATSVGTCLCLNPPDIPGIKLNFFKIIFRECLINALTTGHDEFLSFQIVLQLKDIEYWVKWGIFAGIYYLKTPFTRYRYETAPVSKFSRYEPVHTITVSHYGFKLLRLALRFHAFSYRYRVNARPNRNNFVTVSFRTGIVWTGSESF